MAEVSAEIPKRRFLSFIAKILVCILIFYVLFKRIEISEVWGTFLKTDISFITMAVGVNVAGILLGVYRWKISLAVQQLHVRFTLLLNATLVSRFLGLVMPSFIGGDAIRGYDIFKQTKQGTNIFASILFERICGLISMVIVGSLALYVASERTPDLPLVTPFVVAYSCLVLLIIACFSKTLNRKAISLLSLIPKSTWFRQKIEAISEAIYLYRHDPGVWGQVLALSILYQFLGILFYYVISLSLSLNIPLITFFVLIPIINLVTMTPISPGGLGVKEGMFVLLFYQHGVPPADAVLISLIGTALYLILVLLGSIVYIARPRAQSAA